MEYHDHSYGVIPCRMSAGVWEFLLVKNFRGEWGFPKGHLEPGESPHIAATRELLEETALLVDEWFPHPPFIMRYRSKEVILFTATVKGEAHPCPPEIEKLRWVTLQEGEELATFGESKQVFIELQPLFRSP